MKLIQHTLGVIPMKINETNNKTYKIKRLKKLLFCTFCKPHRGENRKKAVNYKTRKSKNYQFIKK